MYFYVCVILRLTVREPHAGGLIQFPFPSKISPQFITNYLEYLKLSMGGDYNYSIENLKLSMGGYYYYLSKKLYLQREEGNNIC